MAFAEGHIIGDYEVLGVLGQGGMGAVYRVRNVLSGREEAMKMVLPNAGNDAEAAERFLREIRVQASLQHPNIAALRTAVRADDHILMIMELMDGESVAAKLKNGPLPFDLAFRVLDDILGALTYAHRHGVIHRDIKPANIMVTSRGIAKLMDFGIARSSAEDRITRTNFAVGSLHYMSPEQINSQTVDARSDLYSLGATAYEMLTGKAPLDGPNDYAVMHAHLTQKPVPPSELIAGFSRTVSGIVMKALEKNPAARYQSAHEFQSALRDALFAGEISSSRPTMIETRPTINVGELARVESKLAIYVGPIAKSLVARAASKHHDVAALCEELAQQIPDAAGRGSFLKEFGSGEKPRISSNARRAVTPVAEDVLEKARQALARHMGPMAKVMVNRAAKHANSAEELRDALAAEIQDDAGRKAFLKSF